MSRSLFASEVLKAGGIFPEKKKKLKMRNGNRIEFIDDIGAEAVGEAIWEIPRPAGIRAGRVQAVPGQRGL